MRVRKPIDETSDFVPPSDEKSKRKRDRVRAKRQARGNRGLLEKCMREARDRLAAWKGDPNAWVGATPDHLIGLFTILHLHVYGVEPSDLLEAKILLGARSCVASLLRTEFMGDSRLLAEFIRWTWECEQTTEKRFRERGEVRNFRMGWRIQFQSRSHLTSFRVALARQISIASR